jgi:hypothetical protein
MYCIAKTALALAQLDPGPPALSSAAETPAAVLVQKQCYTTNNNNSGKEMRQRAAISSKTEPRGISVVA